MKTKNAFRLAAVLAILIVPLLFAAFTPGQALSSPESNVLQETVIPTVIVPTVIIPETGGDDNNGLTAFFSGWVFWVIFGLILLTFFLMIGRRPTTVHHHETHDHHDDI